MRILIFVLCLILLLATVSTAKILVTSYVEGDIDVKSIVVMEDDGTEIKTIHIDNRRSSRTRWSPDGKQIVFYRFQKPGEWQWQEIVVMNSDGTNERILTQTQEASDRVPVFSPDGKSVLFCRSERIGNESKRSMNVIDLESGKIRKIADFGVNSPDWSPDGKQIVFSPIGKIGNVNSTIQIMDVDGRHHRNLLDPPPQGVNGITRTYARWSPNGKQVVFMEYEFKHNPQLGFIPQARRYFIYDVRTRKTEQLRIPETYFSSGLDWMDDGKSILFSAREVELNVPVKGQVFLYHIYKYNITAKRITRISEQTWENPSLDWISDDVFPVTPQGKKKVTWGTIKQ